MLKRIRGKILFDENEKNVFLKNLNKIGYNNIMGFKPQKNIYYLTLAFQRRFRQSLIDGKIDKECLLISKNLLTQ